MIVEHMTVRSVKQIVMKAVHKTVRMMTVRMQKASRKRAMKKAARKRKMISVRMMSVIKHRSLKKKTVTILALMMIVGKRP